MACAAAGTWERPSREQNDGSSRWDSQSNRSGSHAERIMLSSTELTICLPSLLTSWAARSQSERAVLNRRRSSATVPKCPPDPPRSAKSTTRARRPHADSKVGFSDGDRAVADRPPRSLPDLATQLCRMSGNFDPRHRAIAGIPPAAEFRRVKQHRARGAIYASIRRSPRKTGRSARCVCAVSGSKNGASPCRSSGFMRSS